LKRFFDIVGFVDKDLTNQGIRFFGSNVIGKWEDIPDLVIKHDIGLIILADYRVDTKGYRMIKNICSQTNARLVVMPDILASINHLVKRSSKKSELNGNIGENMDPKCIDCLAQHLFTSKSGLD
jgi:FlaA1/EpsC-like NDP-sugar epimerase